MKDKVLKKLGTRGLIMVGLLFFVGLLCVAVYSPAMATASSTLLIGFGMAVAEVNDGMNRVRTIKFTHTAAVVAGDIIVGNGKPIIAVNDTAADVEGVYVISGLATLPKATGTAYSAGDKVYFDPDDLNIQPAGGSNILCGYCFEDAALNDTTIVILLWPISLETTDAVADSKADSASLRASTADSKAESAVVLDSSTNSEADSKAASNSGLASTADSKAESAVVLDSSTNSEADSKADSNSVIASANLVTGNSKAASLVVTESSNLSTGDSKATSLSVLASSADSKAESAVVLDSSTNSEADSKAASNSVIISSNLVTSDSKAASNSVLISTLDSKVASYHV